MLFGRKNDDFAQYVKINKLPILILDEDFMKSFPNEIKTDKMKILEEEIKELLKEQGRLNDQKSRLKKSKKIRLSKILNLSGDIDSKNSKEALAEMGQSHDTVERINLELDIMEKRLEELPFLIDDKNYELFREALKISYNAISKIGSEIKKIEPAIIKLREKLREKNERKNYLDDEYMNKSVFLRKFIGDDGIKILDERYDGNIK